MGILLKKESPLFTFKTSPVLCKQLKPGISIAINGVCLTVLGKGSDTFSAEVIPETLKRTMLSRLKKDDLVNLELPLTPNSLLSGHIVQGHVDGVGTLEKLSKEANSQILTISFPKDLGKYIVDKGSIAINGISLTIISVSRGILTVGIIPYTFKNTMIHQLKKNDLVNIEVDILAKYVERLLR